MARSIFTKNQVINASLEAIRKDGFSTFSARTVAKALGSSTMPIYSLFGSLDGLEQAIWEAANELMVSYQSKSYTGENLLDIAVGYIAFAREERNLFRYLFIERPRRREEEGHNPRQQDFSRQFGSDKERKKELSEVPAEYQEGLMRNSHIYTHGLAMLVNARIIDPCSDSEAATYLTDAGQAFYMLEQWRETQG